MNAYRVIQKLLVLVLVLFSGTSFLQAAGNATATNVSVMTVAPKKMQVYQSYIGYLKPNDRVVILSETSGTVEKINFEEGARVAKGKILVNVSTEELKLQENLALTNYNQALTDYQVQKTLFFNRTAIGEETTTDEPEYVVTHQLRLQKDMAQKNYDYSLSEYETQKSLHAKSLISDSVFKSYENVMEQARIKLYMANLELLQSRTVDQSRLQNFENLVKIRKANLDMARLELRKSTIETPFAGVVLKKSVQMGGFIQRGTPLLEIIDISTVLAQINIPEKEIKYFKSGQPVTVMFDSFQGDNFEGKIKTINPEADTSSRSFAIMVEINNANLKLLPGMMARVKTLMKSDSNQILIPRHAILERQKGPTVFVEKNGVALEKKVHLGEMVEENVQVISGLRNCHKINVTKLLSKSKNKSMI